MSAPRGFLSGMTAREKTLTIAAMALALLITGRHFVFAPLYSAYMDKKAALTSLDKRITALDAATETLDGLRVRLDAETAKNRELEKRLEPVMEPARKGDQVKKALDALEAAAAGERIKLLEINVSGADGVDPASRLDVGAAPGLVKKRMVFTVESDYEATAALVRNLAGLAPAATLEKISISSDPLDEGSPLVTRIWMRYFELG